VQIRKTTRDLCQFVLFHLICTLLATLRVRKEYKSEYNETERYADEQTFSFGLACRLTTAF